MKKIALFIIVSLTIAQSSKAQEIYFFPIHKQQADLGLDTPNIISRYLSLIIM